MKLLLILSGKFFKLKILMNKLALQNHTFLITRPKYQATRLIHQIEQLGGKGVLFPTIEIISLPSHPTLENAIQTLSEYDYAIFISANAATVALPQWPRNKKLPKIIAIGPSTAKAIHSYHFQTDYIPNEYSSEGIVDLPILQKIENKKIIIYCGANSRPFLKNKLIDRGANVDESICYRRELPTYHAVDFLDKKIDCVITTSKEILENLFHLAEKLKFNLDSIPILIISENMHKELKKMQPNQPYILAENATNNAVIGALIKNFDTINKK